MRRTPIAPMSAKRRAELAAVGQTFPMSTFKPTAKAVKSKRYTDTGPDKATVEVVCARDRWHCACCGDPIYGRRGFEWSIAHRKLRSRGGDNRLSNLYLSCGNGTQGCEGLTHAHPQRAEAAGWMLRSTEDPTQMPMEHSRYGWVLLTDDGLAVPANEEGAV